MVLTSKDSNPADKEKYCLTKEDCVTTRRISFGYTHRGEKYSDIARKRTEAVLCAIAEYKKGCSFNQLQAKMKGTDLSAERLSIAIEYLKKYELVECIGAHNPDDIIIKATACGMQYLDKFYTVLIALYQYDKKIVPLPLVEESLNNPAISEEIYLILNGLENNGYVTCYKDEENTLIKITPEGQEYVLSTEKKREKHEQEKKEAADNLSQLAKRLLGPSE